MIAHFFEYILMEVNKMIKYKQSLIVEVSLHSARGENDHTYNSYGCPPIQQKVCSTLT